MILQFLVQSLLQSAAAIVGVGEESIKKGNDRIALFSIEVNESLRDRNFASLLNENPSAPNNNANIPIGNTR